MFGNYDITNASDPANQSTMAAFSANIAARIAQVPVGEPPASILINIGAHDLIFGLPDGATWRSQFQSALDALNAEWPAARIYLMTPWVRGKDADADTMAGWIDTVIASRAAFVFDGPDERVWFKGADDGAAMGDGTHYNAAGNAECYRQWRARLN